MVSPSGLVYVDLDEAGRASGLASFQTGDTILSSLLTPNIRDTVSGLEDVSSTVADNSGTWEAGGGAPSATGFADWDNAFGYLNNAASGNIGSTSTFVFDTSTDLINASSTFKSFSGTVETSTAVLDASVGALNVFSGTVDTSVVALDASVGALNVFSGTVDASTAVLDASVGALNVFSGTVDASVVVLDGLVPSATGFADWDRVYDQILTTSDTALLTGATPTLSNDLNANSKSISGLDGLSGLGDLSLSGGGGGGIVEIQTDLHLSGNDLKNVFKIKSEVGASLVCSGTNQVKIESLGNIAIGDTTNLFVTSDFKADADSWINAFDYLNNAASGNIGNTSTVVVAASGDNANAFTKYSSVSAGLDDVLVASGNYDNAFDYLNNAFSAIIASVSAGTDTSATAWLTGATPTLSNNLNANTRSISDIGRLLGADTLIISSVGDIQFGSNMNAGGNSLSGLFRLTGETGAGLTVSTTNTLALHTKGGTISIGDSSDPYTTTDFKADADSWINSFDYLNAASGDIGNTSTFVFDASADLINASSTFESFSGTVETSTAVLDASVGALNAFSGTVDASVVVLDGLVPSATGFADWDKVYDQILTTSDEGLLTGATPTLSNNLNANTRSISDIGRLLGSDNLIISSVGDIQFGSNMNADGSSLSGLFRLTGETGEGLTVSATNTLALHTKGGTISIGDSGDPYTTTDFKGDTELWTSSVCSSMAVYQGSSVALSGFGAGDVTNTPRDQWVLKMDPAAERLYWGAPVFTVNAGKTGSVVSLDIETLGFSNAAVSADNTFNISGTLYLSGGGPTNGALQLSTTHTVEDDGDLVTTTDLDLPHAHGAFMYLRTTADSSSAATTYFGYGNSSSEVKTTKSRGRTSGSTNTFFRYVDWASGAPDTFPAINCGAVSGIYKINALCIIAVTTTNNTTISLLVDKVVAHELEITIHSVTDPHQIALEYVGPFISGEDVEIQIAANSGTAIIKEGSTVSIVRIA